MIEARNLPAHVGIIMDGNGRWAQGRGEGRKAGHKEGSAAVRRIVRAARRLGLRALTLYAFSEQNWERPEDEVDALMGLLREFLLTERGEILDNGIRLNAVGNLGRLPGIVRAVLDPLRRESESNGDMTLTLALSYGGREEIAAAAREMAKAVAKGEMRPEDVTADAMHKLMPSLAVGDPRPGHPHGRRATHLEFSPLRSSLRRALLCRRSVAGFPACRSARRHRELPGAGAPLRQGRQAGRVER